MKKSLYKVFVDNRIIGLISYPLVSIVIPPLVGLYYGILDIWGDEWSIIKDHRDVHELVFGIFAVLTIIILVVKGISEQLKGSIQKNYQVILESMIIFFNGLVKKKKDRFFQRAKGVRPKADIFKNITRPEDQLPYVLDGTKDLLRDCFDIDPKNVGITIIQGSLSKDKWWHSFKCDSQKQHTRAKTIMEGPSTARYCFETGESVFIPDIRKGIKEQVFLPSNRSKKTPYGSIFCKPVRIQVNSIEYVYIFTVVVYGQFLCTPYDEDECKACEYLLDEVADRVELELYLHSMKTYKLNGGEEL